MSRLFLLFSAIFSFAFLGISTAQATMIEGAQYDASSQSLYLQLVYNGGEKTHQFSLMWDSCQTIDGTQQIAARLIDSGGDDTGTQEIRQIATFDLSGLQCKPAWLTIRSDRSSHQTLWIQ